ncbi:ABC transporter permease [Rhodovarius crocodyli]|uniref:ABC transporter permease n=1 Tax=Rhodovarius crocodyli TaxID=1979269 RepID=A0A437MFA1_9PROT|nr:ABC transporter permease [Rhodovarius crocodyli]RVT96317.1 ABC transporter permease [Rhodovarius crocodyli]
MSATALPQPRGIAWPGRSSYVSLAMLLPGLAFLFAFLVLPSLVLLANGFMTQHQTGEVAPPFTLANFDRLLFSPAYQRTLLLTLKVAFVTSFVTVVLAYPLAMAIAYAKPWFSRLVMVLVVAPLVVSVLVRSYGWQLLLGNSRTGVLNWLLEAVGFGVTPVKIMFTEWAVVVASVHVFLPLMVLPLATSLTRINPAVIEAARMLGAAPWRAFLRVTLPLSIPGLTAGISVVFSLTAASYITPAMLGGTRGAMLGNLLEQQVTTAYDWAMGGAIAFVMVAIALGANIGATWLIEYRQRARLRASGAR